MMKAFVFPGQGSQKKGMGADLFERYPDYVRQADDILGFSIVELCQQDPQRLLGKTQYTQPALYTINALSYLALMQQPGSQRPDFVAGHSLGEYNALFAAGVFDFATGLKLVKKRGELMGQAQGGGMAAVVGLTVEVIQKILSEKQLNNIDVANFNAPSQLVLSGDVEALKASQSAFEEAGGRFIQLNVSAAFHSQFMRPAQQEFKAFVEQFHFAEPQIPVIANVSARPHQQSQISQLLIEQIASSVQWTDTIRYLLAVAPDLQIEEVGPGNVLSNLTGKIQREAEPLDLSTVSTPPESNEPQPASDSDGVKAHRLGAQRLGANDFKRQYGLDYAYVTGSMYRAIASKEMVVKVANAGMLGFLGTGGRRLEEIEQDIQFIQNSIEPGRQFGANLLNQPEKPEMERGIVDLYQRLNVRCIEASAYMQNLSDALVIYRVRGLSRNANGTVDIANRIFAKASRPEVAEAFLSPAPERILQKLLQGGLITSEQIELAKQVPMADELTAEADSGGHTDQAVAYALMPAMIDLRDHIQQQYQYRDRIRVGAAGGIGTPHAAAAAFMMGADFIVTGSINQCTVEAATSDQVKDLLQAMDVQDTEYAPAGDMFELGAKVQVLRKGLFFPSRANKLYDLYVNYKSLEELPEKTKRQIEEKYFDRSIEDVYRDICDRNRVRNPDTLKKAETNPKHKMALIFRWYFHHSTQLAMQGKSTSKVNYQIHTGPALGAFNRWVGNSDMQSWRNRHVDQIGLRLMHETAELMQARLRNL